MAKNPGKDRCVHCLKEGVERNWDHVFPNSWYPDTTAADMEKCKFHPVSLATTVTENWNAI